MGLGGRVSVDLAAAGVVYRRLRPRQPSSPGTPPAGHGQRGNQIPLIILAARDDDLLSEQARKEEDDNDGRRPGGTIRLPLGPLSEEEVIALTVEALRHSPGGEEAASLARMIHRKTGGLRFFPSPHPGGTGRGHRGRQWSWRIFRAHDGQRAGHHERGGR